MKYLATQTELISMETELDEITLSLQSYITKDRSILFNPLFD